MRAKTCCISSIEEANLATQPSGPGIIQDDLAAKIVQVVAPPVATFMLTSETTSEGIIAHQNVLVQIPFN